MPPGYDAIPHFKQIEEIMRTGSLKLATYPPVFHLLVIAISKIFHLDIWKILVYGTPVLLFLPAVAMFFLLRQISSLKVSVLVTAILLLTSNYPTYGFVDGNYPDMLAYGFFAVLLFAFLIRYFKSKNVFNLIWSGFFLVLIALTHHFTFFNVLGILFLFLLLQFYLFLFRSNLKLRQKFLLVMSSFLFILAIGYLLATELYNGLALRFLTDLLRQSSSIGNAYFATPPNFPDYADLVGPLVWFLGLTGFFYVLVSSFFDKTKNKTKQLVIIWLLFFYILSRFSAAGIPGRFGRELALPLVIFIGFLFEYLIEQNPIKNRMGQIFGYGLIGYLIVINSALYTGLGKIPDGFDNLIWFRPVDQQKADFLTANIPKNTPILFNVHANLYLPIRVNNNLSGLELSTEQYLVVKNYLNFPKNRKTQEDYNNLLKAEKIKYGQFDYIFDDQKPDANTDDVVYYQYGGFSQNKKLLEDLASNYKVVQIFADGATLYKKP